MMGSIHSQASSSSPRRMICQEQDRIAIRSEQLDYSWYEEQGAGARKKGLKRAFGNWYMMIIMRKKITNPELPSRKEETHRRIVEVAARAIRRTGYGGTGVADIMKEAGLTHGGFYAHFDSRDALLAEAGDRAGAESVALAARVAAAAPPGLALQAMMQAYLSPEHIAAIETGCPVSALGSEMPRQAPEVRRAATIHIKEMIDLFARQLPDWGQPQAHEQAMALVCGLIGTTMVARAVDDSKLSQALCAAALKRFLPVAE
jgi:TetR/AcrR family transcriptional repressor of nem operon